MKKLSIILMAMFAMIAMAMPTNAKNLSDEEFYATIEEMNNMCPTDMGNGIAMTSVELAGDNFYINIDTNESNEVIDMINSMSDTMVPMFKKEFFSEEDTKAFVETCRAKKINLVFRMYSKGRKSVANLKLRWEDM